MRRSPPKNPAVPLAFAFLLLAAAPLPAQVPVTVTNNNGDQSAGSLGAAVTTLNNSGSGSITLGGIAPITLTLPLDPLNVGVTFLGGPLRVVGQSSAQARFLSAQGLSQGSGFALNLSNDGALASGLDASVTAADWWMAPNSSVLVDAGDGSSVTTTGGNGETGGDGGDASVTVGSWTVDDGLVVLQAGSIRGG
jgi:hypothetical protein